MSISYSECFTSPWQPTGDGSDDGDYGPDQVVTCRLCGAVIDDRGSVFGADARATHVNFHREFDRVRQS